MAGLEWYPKRTGPGDIDAVGTRKMLGATELDPAELLVREMAQNSWDARDPSSADPPTFGVVVRSLDESSSASLRQEVLTGAPGRLGLVPHDDRVPVVEVFDRGTVGLNGPVRNDRPAGPDRNFIDYVLNVGAPRDMDMGGGTYGYGKTAAYVASRRGVILIWSRTRHDGVLEHRLIASAIGAQGFTHNGLTHTGRHWWGRLVDDRIEPLTGPEAEELANKLFARGFHGDETGTSVLVIDPQSGGQASEPFDEDSEVSLPWTADNLTTGIMKNLWPKLIRPQPAARSMRIELEIDDDTYHLEPVEPLWQAYAQCLRAVRAAQAGDEATPLWGELHEIRSERPRRLLGHLALTRWLLPEDTEPSHDVCLMRHEAELVVKYWQGPSLDDTQFDWVGVFKPVAELDDEFARSEPPAHDDWIPRKGPSPVRIALRRIESIVREFVRPASSEAVAGDGRPAAQLADGLADLVGSREGGRIGAEPARRGGRERAYRMPARCEVVALDSRFEPSASGQRVTVRTQIRTHEPALVVPRIAVLTEGGPDRDDVPVRIHGWNVGGELHPAEDLAVRSDLEAEFVMEAPLDVALDVRFMVRGAE